MIGELLAEDRLVRFLLEQSGVTEVQVDTLLIHSNYRYRGDPLREMVVARDGKVVSKGSFGRSLKQGKRRFKMSFYCIILGYYLGLFDLDLVKSMVRICSTVGQLKGLKIGDERVGEVEELIDKASMRFVGD